MIERLMHRDLLVKIAAVFLAVSMWVYASGLKNPLKTLSVDVEVRVQAAQGRVVVSQDPVRTQVTFEGRENSLAQIKPDQLKITVDASKVTGSSATLPMSFTPPYGGVKVTNIAPRQVTVAFDDLASKEVGVLVSTRGSPNDDYQAESPVPATSTVTVSGPKRRVDQVQVVSGEVDITGAVSSVSAKVPLVAKDPIGNDVAGVTVEPAEVDVVVPMTKRPPAKTVPVRPDVAGIPKPGYKITGVTVSPETVEIRGDTAVTRQVDALYTRQVDVTDRESTFSYSVSLIIPSGITSKVARATVTVHIEEDIVERTFSEVPVQVENLPAGYSWDIKPAQVDVVLTGRSDILARVKASDVQAYIDAAVIQVGGSRSVTRELPVVPRGLPEDVSIKVDIRPQFVQLTLTRR